MKYITLIAALLISVNVGAAEGDDFCTQTYKNIKVMGEARVMGLSLPGMIKQYSHTDVYGFLNYENVAILIFKPEFTDPRVNADTFRQEVLAVANYIYSECFEIFKQCTTVSECVAESD